MNAQILRSSSKETSLSVRDSDIGILYIIQHELLKDNQVEFAGVILRHPLTNEYWVRVNSSKGSPVKEIQKAVDSAIEFAKDLQKTIYSKIKGE